MEQERTQKLLLVVDVQRGFISQKTMQVAARLQTLFSHDLEIPLAFTRYRNREGSPYFRFLDWRSLTTDEECSIVPELLPWTKDIFEKNIYSAVSAEFLGYLESRKIGSVLLAGIDTDCCVMTTAVQLFEAGIRPVVLEHYCASNGGAASHAAAICCLERLVGPKQIVRGEQTSQSLSAL